MPPRKKKQQTSNGSAPDFSKLKVAELRAECLKRSLDDSGTKATLLSRLKTVIDDDEIPDKKPKVKQDNEDEVDSKPTMKDKLKALAEAEKASKKKRASQVDSCCSVSGDIVDDYDCMLNQTNIGANNNKFYVIQLIRNKASHYVWTRWGRVGEIGQSALKGPTNLDAAVKEFEKKFKDKTRNSWQDRDNFESKPGKYTMLEIETADDAENAALEEKLANLDGVDGPTAPAIKGVKPCSLDSATEKLIGLLFSKEMFNNALRKLDLDVKKMPLGKLSKSQIAKGFEVLDGIEVELDSSRSGKLQELTSQFYTLIPHNFGRQRPPVINSHEVLRQKMDMLLVLGDIEIAQTMQKTKEEDIKQELVDHPCDVDYKLLLTDLTHLDKSSEEFKIIETYTNATQQSWRPVSIKDVWKVNRHGEENGFAAHKELDNRKLLWHGTNVAVVAAILKSGLRIMPHSGGRVGKGIYFASENGKSAAYVNPAGCGTGIMFLNEVALGKEHGILLDNSSLKAAPKGFDSVVARGQTEPDAAKDVKLEFDGKPVIVPQGKPKKISQHKNSSFSQSEYLVYKENQCRIRYLITLRF